MVFERMLSGGKIFLSILVLLCEWVQFPKAYISRTSVSKNTNKHTNK
jgi:hypothetical protein